MSYRALTAMALTLVATSPAAAAVLEKTGRFGGQQVAYKVSLPPGYDAAKSYPAVLVFSGGPQTLQGAGSSIEADWRPEADKRGYIVVSPAAPAAGLFFQGGDRAFPEFLETIARDYRLDRRRLHVAGHSNGGLSAFHIAVKHPAWFSTVTGYPGLADGADADGLRALKGKCLFMHVGDRDGGWSSAMKAQADSLKRQGYRIAYTVEKNQGHRLQAAELNLPKRLFDEIESCR